MIKACECTEWLTRRTFLHASAILTFASVPGMTSGAEAKRGRLLVILLRGGMDGLFAMPPVGDPGLKGKRQHLLPNDLLKLDGFFALHPALKTVGDLFASGQALLVHGISNPYTGRSHFDGQDIMESGVERAYTSDSGWLGRALEASRQSSVSMSLPVPLILRGKVPADNRYPTWISNPPPELYTLLAPMWAADIDLAQPGKQLLETVKSTSGMSGVLSPGQQPSLGALASEAGKRLSTSDGPRVAVLDHVGFDTHAAQPGVHSSKLHEIDEAIAEFRKAIGDTVWKETLVVTVTEFGRTVAENGTTGTDHGWGTCVFVVGGALRKSGIVADWPGLRPANLFEGRDLKATLDTRSLYASVVSATLGIDPEVVLRNVIPHPKTKAFDGYFL